MANKSIELANINNRVTTLQVDTQMGFKNKIINGDMSVTQRGRMFSFEDDGDYTADRWYSEIQDGKEEVRQEVVWSKDEGELETDTDPLGNGNLEAKYCLNDDATDETGNHDGTADNVTYVDGKFGKAGSFDGSYVDTDATNGLTKAHVRCFALHDSSQDSSGYVRTALQISNAGDNYLSIAFHNGEWVVYMDDGNTTTTIKSGCNIEDMFIEIGVNVISEDTCELFVNNKSITKFTSTKIEFDDFTIGTDNGHNDNQNFKGIIDQVEVYTDFINQDEEYKLYLQSSNYIQQKQLRSIITKDDTISKYQPFVYRFEGQDLIDYKDEKVTISFNVRSNQTGDFSLALINKSTDDIESYVTKFNYSLDTKEFQRVNTTIPLSDFTKFIRDDEELGFELVIAGIGDETDTEGIQDDEYFYLKDTVKLSENDWIAITDVQLEVGDVVTEFERVSYDNQLDKCLRYYENILPDSSGRIAITAELDTISDINYDNTTLYFKKRKRVVPILHYTGSNISYIDKSKDLIRLNAYNNVAVLNTIFIDSEL